MTEYTRRIFRGSNAAASLKRRGHGRRAPGGGHLPRQ